MFNGRSSELEAALDRTDDSTIIEFQLEYAEQIKELARRAMEDVGLDAATVDRYMTDDFDYETIPEVYKGRSRLWVDLEDAKVVGTIAVGEIDEATARLRRMFVLPELQRKGIGQQLLNTAFNFAQEQGYTSIRLDTDRRMQKAHAFYERNGFIKMGAEGDRVLYARKV